MNLKLYMVVIQFGQPIGIEIWDDQGINRYDFHELKSVEGLTRDMVVPYYSDLILRGSQSQAAEFNEMILSKWKPSGLMYIKEKAWKIVD